MSIGSQQIVHCRALSLSPSLIDFHPWHRARGNTANDVQLLISGLRDCGIAVARSVARLALPGGYI